MNGWGEAWKKQVMLDLDLMYPEAQRRVKPWTFALSKI